MKNVVVNLSIKIGSILGAIQMIYLFCIGILIPDMDNISEKTQTLLDVYIFFFFMLFTYLQLWGYEKYNSIKSTIPFFKGILIGVMSVFVFLFWVSIYNTSMYNFILNEKLPITYGHLRTFDFGLNVFEFIVFSFLSLIINSIYFVYIKLRSKYS